MSLGVGVGPRTPRPKLFQPIITLTGWGGGREGLGPRSACPKRPMCANQQERGVRSRCPHLTAPSQTGSRSRHGGSGSIALPIMHGAGG